jgi:hypothetical protein
MAVVPSTTKNFLKFFSTKETPHQDHPPLPMPVEIQSNSLKLLRTSLPPEVVEVSSVLPDNSKLWMMITQNL